jgi:hypothetical protein
MWEGKEKLRPRSRIAIFVPSPDEIECSSQHYYRNHIEIKDSRNFFWNELKEDDRDCQRKHVRAGEQELEWMQFFDGFPPCRLVEAGVAKTKWGGDSRVN